MLAGGFDVATEGKNRPQDPVVGNETAHDECGRTSKDDEMPSPQRRVSFLGLLIAANVFNLFQGR